MRIMDWSSDVCSADLRRRRWAHQPVAQGLCRQLPHSLRYPSRLSRPRRIGERDARAPRRGRPHHGHVLRLRSRRADPAHLWTRAAGAAAGHRMGRTGGPFHPAPRAPPVFLEPRHNGSPKAYADSLRILPDTQGAYLDLGGSGNETHAHLAADGRITVMFCAFVRGALILRIYGRGRPVLPQDTEWDALAAHFTLLPGTRQIFVIDVESVQTSCGWGVPMMELQHERDTLQKYHRQADRALGGSEERRVGKEGVRRVWYRWATEN